MLHFAVAGVPYSTPGKGGTIEGLRHAHSLGITAMEMEWVQRVPKNEEHIANIRSTAEELGMYLTVHAPYFINLNAIEEEKLEASKIRILDAMEMGQLAGAHSVCVHPAFYLKMDPEEVYDNVYRATDDIMKPTPIANIELQSSTSVPPQTSAQSGTQSLVKSASHTPQLSY